MTDIICIAAAILAAKALIWAYDQGWKKHRPYTQDIEFLAAALMSVLLLAMGLFMNAPLEDLANGNVTPAVAKAPWYVLGLQELLAYFHPTVAGVLAPTFVLVGAALIPFIDREKINVHRPSDRKTTVVLFSLFAGLGLFVTFVGIFFRGPGWELTLPWRDGIY